MQISTYQDFYREMLERCAPQAAKRKPLNRACELMWYDGLLTISQISRQAGVAHGTASRWVGVAKALGLQPGVRRHATLGKDGTTSVDIPDISDEESRLLHNSIARNMNNPKRTRTTDKGLDVPQLDDSAVIPPRKAPSSDQLRTEAVEMAYNDMLYSRTPETRFKAIETLTKIVPGFKAPETRLDVQILIGKGAEDRLTKELRDNLKFLMREDPNWVQELMTDIGVPIQIPEVTDAETEALDDAPDPDRALPGANE